MHRYNKRKAFVGLVDTTSAPLPHESERALPRITSCLFAFAFDVILHSLCWKRRHKRPGRLSDLAIPVLLIFSLNIINNSI